MSFLQIIAILCGSIAITWFLVRGYRLIPSPLIYLHPKLRPFIKQARADQKITDYPGCAEGIMFCRSTSCWCINESERAESFVLARCRHYAAEAGDKKILS